MLQATDSDFSMSSEMDDPLGMQHLFEEQLSGISTNTSPSAAATRSYPSHPWASVLQLSLQCLIDWMQSSWLPLNRLSYAGWQSHHLDAVLYLIAQGPKFTAAGQDSAPVATGVHHSISKSSSDMQVAFADLLQTLGDEMLRTVLTADWARVHTVRHVLISDASVSSSDHSSGPSSDSGRAEAVLQLAATCLMTHIQDCLSCDKECKLVCNLWEDLIAGCALARTGSADHHFLWQLSQPR